MNGNKRYKKEILILKSLLALVVILFALFFLVLKYYQNRSNDSNLVIVYNEGDLLQVDYSNLVHNQEYTYMFTVCGNNDTPENIEYDLLMNLENMDSINKNLGSLDITIVGVGEGALTSNSVIVPLNYDKTISLGSAYITKNTNINHKYLVKVRLNDETILGDIDNKEEVINQQYSLGFQIQ